MRQSSGSRRAYNEYGYPPKTSSGGGGGASRATPNPEVVINGHGHDSSGDSMSSGNRHRGDNARLGSASNPNRSDVPERNPHDQTTSLVSQGQIDLS